MWYWINNIKIKKYKKISHKKPQTCWDQMKRYKIKNEKKKNIIHLLGWKITKLSAVQKCWNLYIYLFLKSYFSVPPSVLCFSPFCSPRMGFRVSLLLLALAVVVVFGQKKRPVNKEWSHRDGCEFLSAHQEWQTCERKKVNPAFVF